jgi:hypothetical protein
MVGLATSNFRAIAPAVIAWEASSTSIALRVGSAMAWNGSLLSFIFNSYKKLEKDAEGVYYSQPDILLAQKFYAIIKRKRSKGRDFFDVVFLLSKGVRPDY